MFQQAPGVRIGAASILLVASATILGCAKQAATSEECRAAIVHMMEVQLDSPDFQNIAGQGAPDLAQEHLQEGKQWLKSQIPKLVTPAAVSQCVERMPRKDTQCTMSATTIDELIHKCHWKVVAGPKGSSLGF
jgi:hypothetical protein